MQKKRPIHIFRCFFIATTLVAALFLGMDSHAAMIGHYTAPVPAQNAALYQATSLSPPPRYSPDRTLDVQTLHQLVSRGLGAIQKRDADAFARLSTRDFHDRVIASQPYAAISHKRASNKRFLGYVRQDYWPIYNHRAISFLDSAPLPGGIMLQKIRMVDHTNQPFTAIIRLKAQVDGAWLIDSIIVLDHAAQPV